MRAAPPRLLIVDDDAVSIQRLACGPRPDVPMTFITSHAEKAMEFDGLAAGAADFIAKPVRPALPAAP